MTATDLVHLPLHEEDTRRRMRTITTGALFPAATVLVVITAVVLHRLVATTMSVSVTADRLPVPVGLLWMAMAELLLVTKTRMIAVHLHPAATSRIRT